MVGAAFEKVCNRSVAAKGTVRARASIERFLDGFDVIEPGLVYIPEWRPYSPEDVPEDPGKLWALVGVGRKP
ncbi:MAG: SAM-dependent methyltransferase [Micromonosporaceae bacterium]